MEAWMKSVHSDGTAQFVSPQQPVIGQTVTIRLQLLQDAPVRHVLLRTEPNGIEHSEEMTRIGCRHGLAVYEGTLTMTEPRMRYRFYLVGENALWYYNQLGLTDSSPDRVYDFQLLAVYRQPEWVKQAVFYQIFPERFCDGDPSLDVKDGEYALDGHPTIHRAWSDAPLPYQQGYCMDFFGGDLDGIRLKIPYLKKLGVTALYINPIFCAPTAHKFDCIDYFHIDPHFGGDEALARLSGALHDNGMKLVLDISINHTGTAHRWFNRDGLFFDRSEGAYNNPNAPERNYYFFNEEDNSYKGWDDLPNMPVLNYGSDALRDIVYRSPDSVIRKWLKPPYCIDGWRFDVADVFARNNAFQFADEVWPELCAAIREENPDAYILAEDWGDCSWRMQGKAYDATMNYYGCTRIVRQFFGGHDIYMDRSPVLGRLQRITTAEMLEKRVTGFLAKMPCVLAQNQFNLLNSHDVPRIQHMPFMTPETVRGAVLLMFLLPGTPNIYYGDEAAIGGGPDTIEDCRYPMPWDRDIEALPEWKFYHRLADLKRQEPAFSDGSMKFIYAQGKVTAIARFDGNRVFVGVVSASESEETVRLPLYTLGAAAPDSETDLFGRTLRFDNDGRGSPQLKLHPGEALLFRCAML